MWQRGRAPPYATAAAGLLGFLNLVVLQSITGASLGKLMLGLRVVDQQGNKAGVGRMLGRWVLLLVDALCFLVGLITVLVTHPHRRVGDLACGTYVVATGSVGQPIALYPVGHAGLRTASGLRTGRLWRAAELDASERAGAADTAWGALAGAIGPAAARVGAGLRNRAAAAVGAASATGAVAVGAAFATAHRRRRPAQPPAPRRRRGARSVRLRRPRRPPARPPSRSRTTRPPPPVNQRRRRPVSRGGTRR